ncbi:MAG: endo-1,4-beta-xylanase [Clostridiaceae bacterium]|nr:endo-1,4-beta-xylanase [Clostridiaceae bacterium]
MCLVWDERSDLLEKTSKKVLTFLLAFLITFTSIPFINTAAQEVMSLKEVYKDYFLIGNVINPSDLTNTEKYNFIKFHYNALTPENNTKPDYIWPDSTREPSFTAADNMLTQVKADGFYAIGHALAWHNQSSGWPPSGQNYAEARESLRRYIHTIAGHYSEGPYKLDAWDVVNEAMRDNPENPTDWRNALRSSINPPERPSRWYQAYANGGNGWDYIYDAFLFAREAAPDAVLYYNDFNDEELPNKAIAIASMVKELNERYAKEHPEANGRKLIEGIGIQAHYSTRLNIDNLEKCLKIYIETGCRISITELDVQINGTSLFVRPTEQQLKEQAEVYAKLFMLFKKYADYIERVTFWGVADNNSWRSGGYPLPFDSSRQPKEAYWAIVNPEQYLGLDVQPPKLTSFEFGGEVFNVGNKTEFDVNVPKTVSNIAFSAENITHPYPADDVDVSVTLNPADGAVSAGKPCVAAVKIAWKESPDAYTSYTINFGHMTATWDIDQNYPDTGYRSTVNIRFSDGESSFKLFQEFYNLEDGKLVMLNSKEFSPLPKHASGTFTIRTDSKLDTNYLKTLKLKKSVWDQNWTPIAPARVTDFNIPENYWKLAKTIETDKTYIVVSVNSGLALTNKNVATVPATGGVTNAKRGLAGTAVTIENDIIVAPNPIPDNIRFIFWERTSPDPGPYTKENGYTGYLLQCLVHGSSISPYIMWRDTSSDMTAPLRTDATIGDNDLDRAVWFNTGIDPETGETTLFLHTGSSNYTYALHGNEAGFVGQGGTGPLEQYAEVSRVKLYEYVSDYSYEDITSVGTKISLAPVESLVTGCDADITVRADVPDGCKAFLVKDGVSLVSATFENGKATISVKGSDVVPGSNYAIVIYDDSEILGAVVVPVEGAGDNVFNIGTEFNMEYLIPNKVLDAKVNAKNNGSEDYQVLVILALYDPEGRMVNVSYISKQIVAGSTEEMNAGFILPEDVTGYKAKVFVWEGQDLENSSMTPLSNVSEIS